MLACERFAGRLPDPLELAGRDLIRACPPHPERPFPVLSAPQSPGRSILPVPDPPDKGDQPCLPSPSRSTPARPPPEDGPPDRPGSSGCGAATEPSSPPSAFPAPAPSTSPRRSPTSSPNRTPLTEHMSIDLLSSRRLGQSQSVTARDMVRNVSS